MIQPRDIVQNVTTQGITLGHVRHSMNGGDQNVYSVETEIITQKSAETV